MKMDDQRCTIYLLRHGQTDHNRDGRLMGHLGVALAAHGRAQARRAAGFLAGQGIAAVYTSDLARAQATAEIVGGHLGLAVQPHPGLREIDVGLLAGLTRDEIGEGYPEYVRAAERDPLNTRMPEGESFAELTERAWAALAEIAAENAGRRVLAVTHGGVMRAAFAQALAVPWPAARAFGVENCGVIKLNWSSSGPSLLVPGPLPA